MERKADDFEIAMDGLDLLDSEISQQELAIIRLYFADVLQEMMKKEETI